MNRDDLGVMQTLLIEAGALKGVPAESLVVLDNDGHLSDCELLVYASGITAEGLRSWVEQEQRLRAEARALACAPAHSSAPQTGISLGRYEELLKHVYGDRPRPPLRPNRLEDFQRCPYCDHNSATFSDDRRWICDACGEDW
ncbi:MAG: hypothetical protein HC771_22325 [Synechococcales cyanobacterium CRU_2_2]|nr:hypothetical protein [Synechococcales cyanobacterium CRU_2_2]